MDRISEFCRTHHPDLINYAKRCGAAPDDAEDIVQEVWIRLVRTQRLLSLMDQATPRAFLLTLTKSIVRNAYKGRNCPKRGGDEKRFVAIETLAGFEPADFLTPDRVLSMREAEELAKLVGAFENEDGVALSNAERSKKAKIRKKWRAELREFVS